MQNLLTKTKKLFNNKYTKYFLIGTFVLFFLFILNYYIFDISIFSGITHAADGATNEREWVQLLSYWLRTAYVVLWPLLTVAGASLSNELVYGSVFGLEVPLWNLWNVMKNFANYSIGFLFVVSVFVSLFSNNEKFSPKKLIPKLIIAAISIQASWFLVGALVDISTILTYSFGMLPIDILGESDMFSQPMIQSDVLYSMEDDSGDTDDGDDNEEVGFKKDMLVTYNYGNKSMVPCLFSGGQIVTNESPDNGFTEWIERYTGKSQENNDKFSERYCMGGPSKLIDIEGISNYDFTNTNLEKWQANTSIDKAHFGCDDSENDSENNGEKDSCPKLSNISDKANGAGGIFYGLYGSILNMSDLLLVDSKMSTSSLLFETVIKLFIGAALIVPLFTLAVVLIMRVVVLWGIIAFSPIIIAAIVFGFSPGSGTSSKLMNPKNILTLIFIPVVTTFALSISVIFLSLISNQSGMQGGSGQGVFGALGMSEVEQTDGLSERCIVSEIIGNEICFNYPDDTVGSMLDLIGWLLVNIFGIAFMWTVVFAALKTSKITEGTVDSIQKTTEGLMQAAPIIPGPGGEMTSMGALGKAKGHLEGVPERMHGERFTKEIEPFMNRISSNMTGDTETIDNNMQQSIDTKNFDASNVAKTFKNKAEGTNIYDYDNALPLMKSTLEEYGASIDNDAGWSDVMATTEFDEFLKDAGIDDHNDWVENYMSQNGAHNAEEIEQEMKEGIHESKILSPPSKDPKVKVLSTDEELKYVYYENSNALWFGDKDENGEVRGTRFIDSPSSLNGLPETIIDKLKDKFDDYDEVDSKEDRDNLQFNDEVIESNDGKYYGFKKKEEDVDESEE